MKKTPFITLLTALAFLTACEAFRSTQPIPKEKESFIGVWLSRSGYTLHIKATGTATIKQVVNSNAPDFDTLNIKVAPPVIEDIRVEFKGDSILLVIKPLVYAKEFRIDHSPYRDGDTTKMVLNGVTLMKESQ